MNHSQGYNVGVEEQKQKALRGGRNALKKKGRDGEVKQEVKKR